MARGTAPVQHGRLWRLAAPGLVVLVTTALTGVVPASASVSPGNTVGVGLPPTAIAVDAAAHTAYVVTSDASDDQVAVVDTAACTAHPSSSCSDAVATVTLDAGSGPAADAVAFDSATSTVYVANASVGSVEMLNARTCNATVTTSCDALPVVAMSGLAWPSAIAVDTTGGHDVVYVADRTANSVTVVSGTACNASATAGCATTATIPVGNGPDALTVDSPAATVYVANATDGSVSTLNETACSTLASSCRTPGRTVPLGDETPAALVADPADETVFIADTSTGDVSFLNTSHCTIAVTGGCSAVPRTMSGLSAAGIGLTTQGDVAVADSTRHRVVAFAAATCNAATTTGCTFQEVDPLLGAPSAVAVNAVTIYSADPANDRLDIVATPSMVVKLTTAHRLSAYGWYRSPVTVSYVCAAGSAALASKCPGAVTVSKNTEGRSFAGALISDDGGRVSSGAFVRVDVTKPTVKVIGVVNGKRYAKGRHPKMHCVGADALSGLASCKVTVTDHGFHGLHRTYTGTAIDKAGNVKRVHGRFTLS